jgi:hypothetical protein
MLGFELKPKRSQSVYLDYKNNCFKTTKFGELLQSSCIQGEIQQIQRFVVQYRDNTINNVKITLKIIDGTLLDLILDVYKYFTSELISKLSKIENTKQSIFIYITKNAKGYPKPQVIIAETEEYMRSDLFVRNDAVDYENQINELIKQINSKINQCNIIYIKNLL